jgi:hypothetical protein
LKNHVEVDSKISASTREKYKNHIHNHILPRWRDVRLADFRPLEAEEWLRSLDRSWWMMVDIRNIMSGIFTQAQAWGYWPEDRRNPMAQSESGPASARRVPSASSPRGRPTGCWRAFRSRTRLIAEIAHFQRRADLRDSRAAMEASWTSSPASSRSSSATGAAIWTRRKRKAVAASWSSAIWWRGCGRKPRRMAPNPTVSSSHAATAAVSPCGTRACAKAVKKAAAAEGCDFPGLGMHALRRANITWWQEEGGSAIEASKNAGHSSVAMTNVYTLIQLERKREITRTGFRNGFLECRQRRWFNSEFVHQRKRLPCNTVCGSP